jgi:hypothetical protein
MKAILYVAGAALVFGMGAAAAEEPLVLGASEMDGVTAGCSRCGGTFYGFTKRIDVDVDKNFDIDSDVDIDVDIDNAFADAEALAGASGFFGAYSETFTETTTASGLFTPFLGHRATSYSGSISASE